MMHVPPKPSSDEIYSLNRGDEIVVTPNLLNHWRPARSIPADGGVPGVVIFKYKKRGRVSLPSNGRMTQGFALFLPDGLKIGQKLRVEWRDPGCAMALPIAS